MEELTTAETHAKYRLERRSEFGRRAERAGRVAQLCGKANIEETVDDEELFILQMCAKTPEAKRLRDEALQKVKEWTKEVEEDQVEAKEVHDIEQCLLDLHQFLKILACRNRVLLSLAVWRTRNVPSIAAYRH